MREGSEDEPAKEQPATDPLEEHPWQPSIDPVRKEPRFDKSEGAELEDLKDFDTDLWLLLETQSVTLRSGSNAAPVTDTYSVEDRNQRLRITVSRAANLTWNFRVEAASGGPRYLKIRWQSGAEQSHQIDLVRGTTKLDVEAVSPEDRPIATRIEAR